MRNSNEQSLKEIIGTFLTKNQLGNQLKEAQLIADWSKIAGDMIAKYTTKMYVNKGVLYLYIQSPALKQELNFQKKQLIELTNQHMGAEFIKDIVLR
jgi:predicted nucleic acid-binding Zn ribbon protein